MVSSRAQFSRFPNGPRMLCNQPETLSVGISEAMEQFSIWPE